LTLTTLKARVLAMSLGLVLLNAGAWLWTLIAFRGEPALLGVALVVYGLGLRHAVDADHIAAIDNVTRKLMQMGDRPVAVGFFFAIGHSAVVIIVTALVAGAATFAGRFNSFKQIGDVFGPAVSALFLFAIAAMNIVIFVSIYRSFRRLRRGGPYIEDNIDLLLDGRGFLARIFRPLFGLVTKSWHMLLLGFLFGLGFDTATEVAMFGLSAAQAAKAMPLTDILAFPALFAAGMSLVDTTDGMLMLGAYAWAFVKPVRKLYYNLSITFISIVVALVVGGIEVFGLIADHLTLKEGVLGRLWSGISALNDHFNALGFAIIGLFLAAWAISFAIYKIKHLDELDVGSA
jgi:high-affinity nickel-transport protein